MSLFPALRLWRLVAVLLPSQYPRFNLDFNISTSALSPPRNHETVTFGPRPSSSLQLRPCAVPCAFAHWCACAVREPEDSGDGASRGRIEFQSGAGCSSELPCGDRL